VGCDTFVERMPKRLFADRHWRPRDNPKTAVREFLASNPQGNRIF
jgi:cephalosporin hydroxylase